MAIIRTKKEICKIKRTKNTDRHAKLIEVGIRILKKGNIIQYITLEKKYLNANIINKLGGCSPVFKEPQNLTGYLPDIIGFTWLNSVVIECKTSLADFRNDSKKKVKRAGNVFLFLSYTGIIPVDELSSTDGLLELDENGNVTQIVIPKFIETPNVLCETAILLSILRGKNINART